MHEEMLRPKAASPPAGSVREGPCTLRPIEIGDQEDAVRLLAQGFPQDGPDFWRRCLQRQASVQSGSYGFFLDQGERPVGLMLTLRSWRRLADGSQVQMVNLSSWYIERTYRRRSVMMLRALAEDQSAVLTALTAASQVQRLSATIDSTAWSTGMILASAAPFAAMPGRPSTRILPFDAARTMMSADDEAMLAWHAGDGHIAAAMIEKDMVHPLIFRVIGRKGVRFAQLIFAPSRRAVLRNLPPLMRFLARRGILFASIDGDKDICPRGAFFRAGRPRFWRGPIDRDRLDYAFSELVLFGVS